MEHSSTDTHISEMIFRVAWLAVALGVGVELVLLVVNSTLHKSSSFGFIAADLVQKISWSVFVCVGLAIGLSASKMKIPAGFISGMLAAPFAFAIARTLHKSLSQGLGISVAPGVISPITMSLVKGAEYAVLGGLIAWFQVKNITRFWPYVLAGGAVGLSFAAALWLLGTGAGETAVGQFAKGINEFLGPLGCTVVQYGARAFGGQSAGAKA